ncbi:MAG: DUF4097 family beta strand repeat protein [Myxococcales bacterium]|nr:DUF4097 family beta strand repeat protein [Myxococcales bacterium]
MARPAAGEERTVPTQGIVSVEIRSRSGDIRVYKGDDPAHISTWGDQVKVEVQGTQLLVSSHADLRLKLPDGLERLSVTVRAGDARVEAAPKRLRVNSAAGDIVVTAPGVEEAEVESLAGDVRWRTDARRLAITAVSGEVTVVGEVEEADLTSTNGDVRIEGAVLPRRLEAGTVSGDVTMKGGLQKDATLTARTMSGDVRLSYRGEHGPRVYARSRSGGVSVDGQELAPDARHGHPAGDGSAELVVSTFSGSVRVRPLD